MVDRASRKRSEVSAGGSRIVRHLVKGVRSPRFTEAPDASAERREEYFERHFGTIEGVYHEVVVNTPHIDVYICTRDDDGYATLVTGGMSDTPMRVPQDVPKERRRVELLMYVCPADMLKWQEEQTGFPQDWLVFLARIPHSFSTWLGPGHTVPNGDPPTPLLPGSLLTTALLLPAVHEPPDVANGLELARERVGFLWVVLITDAECEFKLRHGTQALVSLLQANGHPKVLDMSRCSYV